MPTTTSPEPRIGLVALIHAEPKTGKTWLLATAPKPLLILDAEGGSRFIPKLRKRVWDPSSPPPEDDGTWDVAIVQVRKWKSVTQSLQWLSRGKHPFKSIGLDTLTSGQKRDLDEITGGPEITPEQTHWGVLLRHMEDVIQEMCDLVVHPTRPLECVVLTAHTHLRDGKFRPLVKGQLELTLPGFPDVIGYLIVATNSDTGKLVRKLAIQPVRPEWLAGDRTHTLTQVYGPVIESPHLGKMVETLNTSSSEGEA